VDGPNLIEDAASVAAPIESRPLPRSRRWRLAHHLRFLAVGLAVVLTGTLVDASVPRLSAGSATSSPVPSAVALVAVVAIGRTPTTPLRRPDPVPSRIPAAQPPVLVPPVVKPIDFGPMARLVYRVRTTQKVIALTFDDGWSPPAGRLILDTLLREHVAATFFVNSMYVRWDPELWRRIAAAGFPIGNHTYDHRDLTSVSSAEIAKDIAKDAAAFRELTGFEMAPLFRPPYGARSPRVDAAILQAGYPTEILWDVVAGDTSPRLSDRALIANASAGRAGSIVLMHVGPASTPRILAAVIARYRARGFRFVTIPQLLAIGG
jgi:peptidoglycan/xylan/chitin deacetylase (PgdA/CDA1 family)